MENFIYLNSFDFFHMKNFLFSFSLRIGGIAQEL